MERRQLLRVVLTGGLALLVRSASAQAVMLTVSAAASLTDVMKELGRHYEATRPGTSVRFNFGASGALLQQIVHGAPVDVFVSADEETVDSGFGQKLFEPDSHVIVASNSLVLVTRASADRPIRSLQDLMQARRIAVGKPASVPAGRYAKQALDAQGLWASLESRFVFAENVRQVLDYVVRGEVDAGFVYATDAALVKDRVRTVLTVSGGRPIVYPAVVVVHSRHRKEAEDFLRFLASKPARLVWQKAGFAPPP